MNNRKTTYSTFAVVFYINRQKVKKNGLCPLMGRISINKEIAQFSAKIDIDPALWDAKRYRLKGKSRDIQETNCAIEKLTADIHRYYNEILSEQGYITAELVKNAINGIGMRKQKLLELYQEYIDEFSKQVGLTRALGTLHNHHASYNRLKKFIQAYYNADDITLRQLDYSFIEKYEHYLRVDMKRSLSTVEGFIIMLKTIVKRAIAQGTLLKNPFTGYFPEKAMKKHRHLELDELKRLMETPIQEKFLCYVRDLFVFSTFTGISYIDLCNLREENFYLTEDGKLWVRFNRQKTKSECIIQILDLPRLIMDKYKDQRVDDRIFKVPVRSALTANFRKLAEKCNINKRVTFHMARHNFGSLITLSQGVPLESVCKMMGHKNISTTQLYAKLTHQKVNEDIKRISTKVKSKYEIPEWNKGSDNVKNIHYGQREQDNQ
jgi:tyrosine type site-specific recombinase